MFCLLIYRPQTNKGSEDLPIEYLTSSLAQQNQVCHIFIF